MNSFLLFRDHDFFPERPPNPQDDQVVQDLELRWIFAAMANGDKALAETVRAVMFASLNRLSDIEYRQSILSDCLSCPDSVRRVAAIADQAIAGERKIYKSTLRRPSSTLGRSLEVLQMFLQSLRDLRRVAGEVRRGFQSEGMKRFFQMVVDELDENYLRQIEYHIDRLKFRDGVVISAALGKAAKGINYTTRSVFGSRQSWLARRRASNLSNWFEIAPRDDAGAQALGELKDRGISSIANTLAQSCHHILQFFTTLAREISFYVGCLNLSERLASAGAVVSIPTALPQGYGVTYANLSDTALVLQNNGRVVGNTLETDRLALALITGANSGGKSTFLRSIGQAQLMMQCGMFVCASTFRAGVTTRVFTHFIREEDTEMSSGRLEEELLRMSALIDVISPFSLVLFNESFAATNEREGSEIAWQVVCALMESKVRVFFVTHLYELADRLLVAGNDEVLFLRAERRDDGARTFRIVPGTPLLTSFGTDILERYGGWGSHVDDRTPKLVCTRET